MSEAAYEADLKRRAKGLYSLEQRLKVLRQLDEATTAAGVNWDASTYHHGEWVKAAAEREKFRLALQLVRSSLLATARGKENLSPEDLAQRITEVIDPAAATIGCVDGGSKTTPEATPAPPTYGGRVVCGNLWRYPLNDDRVCIRDPQHPIPHRDCEDVAWDDDGEPVAEGGRAA